MFVALAVQVLFLHAQLALCRYAQLALCRYAPEANVKTYTVIFIILGCLNYDVKLKTLPFLASSHFSVTMWIGNAY